MHGYDKDTLWVFDITNCIKPLYYNADQQIDRSHPTPLQCIEEIPVTNGLYTVFCLSESRLITGGYEYLEMRDTLLNPVKSVQTPANCWCIRAFPGDKLAVLLVNQSSNVLEIYSSDLIHEQTLFEVITKDDGHISVGENCIVLVDRSSKLLRFYDLNGHQTPKKHIDLLGMKWPWGVHITRDDHVLVSDCVKTGCVRKYKIPENSESQRELVWNCLFLKYPTGICAGSAGEIYVASRYEECIYQINLETGVNHVTV